MKTKVLPRTLDRFYGKGKTEHILSIILLLTLALSSFLAVANMVPDHTMITVQAFTKDLDPHLDDVVIRIYPAGTAIENASSPSFEDALAVVEAPEGECSIDVSPGDYLITAWKAPLRDDDQPRLVSSEEVSVPDVFSRPTVTMLTEKTEGFILKLWLFDTTYPDVPLDSSALRVELRGVRKELSFVIKGDGPYMNGGSWKGFKEYDTKERKLTHNGYFLVTGLDRKDYLVQIWDGCHLIGRFWVFMNEDKEFKANVPYERQERSNAAYWAWKEHQDWLAEHQPAAPMGSGQDDTHALGVNLVDPQGNPMPDHAVQVQDLEGNVLQEGTTALNEQGNAYVQFTDLPTDMYRVYAPGEPEPTYVYLASDMEITVDPSTMSLITVGGGLAEWTTEQKYAGDYSVKLVTVASSDLAMVLVLIGDKTLSDVASVSYSAWVTQTAEPSGRYRPWVGIYLDSDGNLGTWEYYIQAEPMYAYPCGAFGGSLNTWEKWDSADPNYPLRWVGPESPDFPYEAPTLQDYISGSAVNYPTAEHGDQSFATREYGTLTVIKIKFMVGYGTNWENFLGYIDKITISGVTDNLELPPGRPLTVDDDRAQCPDAYFQTIQAAIDCAITGDTILVYPGTYNENVVVDKMLTLEGVNRETTIVKAKLEAPVLTVSAGGVTVSGFTINDDGKLSGVQPWLITVKGNDVLLTDLHITRQTPNPPRGGGVLQVGEWYAGGINGFTFTDSIVYSAYRGVDVWSSSSNIVIRKVDFTAPGDCAVLLLDTIGATIAENTFRCTDKLGVVVGGSSDDIEISDNQFIDFGSADKAIRLDGGGALGDVAILRNGISGFNTGIFLSIEFGNLVTSGISIHNNDIAGNTYGVKNMDPDTVDATLNWWGDATGPSHSSNPHGTGQGGDAVSDNVDFMPWYATSTTTPETEYVTVEHPGSSVIALSDTIQGGIDAALDGDTILVCPGTYAETAEVDVQDLTIRSTEGPLVTTVKGHKWEGSGWWGTEGYYDIAFQVIASGVTIEGFTIDQDRSLTSNPTWVGFNRPATMIGGWFPGDYGHLGVEHVVIRNNIFVDTWSAVYIWKSSYNLIIGNIIEGCYWRSIQIYDGSDNGQVAYDPSYSYCNPPIRDWQGNLLSFDPGKLICPSQYNRIVDNDIRDGRFGGIFVGAWQTPGTGGLWTDNTGTEVIGNRIHDTADIGIGTGFSMGSKVFSGNTITRCGVGIQIMGDGATGTAANYNSIFDNTLYGVYNELVNPMYMIDAENNWWGDISGPFHPTDNPSGLGNAVSDNVDHRPWTGMIVTGTVPAGATTTVDATVEAGTDVTITTQPGASGTVSVASYPTNPGGAAPSGFSAAGKYISITTDLGVNDIAWPVYVRVYYTDGDIAGAGLVESTLEIRRWHGGAWMACNAVNFPAGFWGPYQTDPESTGVNTALNYVWANLWHLSEFGVIGIPVPPTVGPPAGAPSGAGRLTIRATLVAGSTVAVGGYIGVGLGEFLDLSVEAESPGKLTMTAWAVLTGPDGVDREYKMIEAAKEEKRSTFTVSIDTSRLSLGNYTLWIYVRDSSGDQVSFGPVTIEIKTKLVPPPPVFPFEMLGVAVAVVVVAVAAYAALKRRRLAKPV